MNYERYKNLLVEKQNGICTVTINIPETRNALLTEVQRQVSDIWVDLAQDEEVKAIIITGAGKAFSAGGNIKAMVERHGTEANERRSNQVPFHSKRLIENILNTPQPTIAAINGDAMGLGATIALLCDIQIMSETARIGDSHVKIGLVAGDGGAVIWPFLIGMNRAKEYMMRGKVINGVEAEKINLVNYCTPAENVMPMAREIATELAALPPLALRWTKTTMNKQLKEQFNLVMDAAIAYEVLSSRSHDHLEAATAFLEKRKGSFKGI